MPRKIHNKTWDMKYIVHRWSERALFLFKVMCSFEKSICMIAYYASFPFHKYSGVPYFPAYKANYNWHQVCFDFDSCIIGVNNHCLATMSPNKDHFKDLKLKQIGECTGIGIGLTIAGKGTFLMNIEDDNGGVHKIKIPNSFYFPGLWMVLLSPQHWAQQAKDTVPDPLGTCMINSHLPCTLYWNQKKFKKTVPFDDTIITPSFHTAPGCFHYQAFASTFEALEAHQIPQEETIILPDMIKYQREQDSAPEADDKQAELI